MIRLPTTALALISIPLYASCTAPDPTQIFNELNVVTMTNADEVSQRFIAAIEGANSDLKIALPSAEDTEITAAIVAAWEAGVAVEVCTDIDNAAQQGAIDLQNANVPLTFNDGELSYFDFGINRDLVFDSTITQMTHAYVIADGRTMTWANEAGSLTDGPRVGLEIRGEELIEDWILEHNQIFAESDATSTTLYGGLAKSIADYRWMYYTTTEANTELWFGPQERLTKRVIDAVYAAQSSVYIVTDDMTNRGLSAALQSKAKWGFDVKLVVGPSFDENLYLNDPLMENTPDVPKKRITTPGHVPTIIIIDGVPDATGTQWMSRGMMLSHDLVSAERTFTDRRVNGGDPVEVQNDQLLDGALWVFNDRLNESEEIKSLTELFNQLEAQGEDFQ